MCIGPDAIQPLAYPFFTRKTCGPVGYAEMKIGCEINFFTFRYIHFLWAGWGAKLL